MTERFEVADHYAAHYRDFAADVYRDVRREAFGSDVGQNSWLTVEELERFGCMLELGPQSRLLDVACGSGGPSLHLARLTGCQVVGVELFDEAVANGTDAAREAGLESRVSFVRADAGERLPFESGSFDAVLCIDAVNHLRSRARVFAEWARLLRPEGRSVFTDPVVVTGAISADEMAGRASIGYFLFLPPGENERLLEQASLDLISVDDTTGHLAEVARRRHDARANHADELTRLEGAEAYEGRQRFFALVAALAGVRRLSRFVYAATRAS